MLELLALGSDGVEFINLASIRFDVDSTPSDGDMPGRIVFFTTPDGSLAPTERMRINCDGQIIRTWIDHAGDARDEWSVHLDPDEQHQLPHFLSRQSRHHAGRQHHVGLDTLAVQQAEGAPIAGSAPGEARKRSQNCRQHPGPHRRVGQQAFAGFRVVAHVLRAARTWY
ncbi:MAG TPA: hypothetical protein VFR73_21160, partial [Hyphomicrobiaceae bacterium]|nr:hypothetical protein [Hyphomicrobiaceae bacterium]